MSLNSSESSTVFAGNTNKNCKEKKVKQDSCKVRYCFTLNNYSDDDIQDILLVCSDSSKYYVFSREVGKEGTPHLQGYIEFKKKCRPIGLFKNKAIHWEGAGGLKRHNFSYCTKEGGECWVNGKHFKPVIEPFSFRPWQKKLVDIGDTKADARTINYIWESSGNVGKSWLAKWWVLHRNALILSNKGSDMKNGVMQYIEKNCNFPDIIIIDIPRSVDCQYISWTGIEEIKGGCFFSPKYEGGNVCMPYPHIFIFSNEEPDIEMLSSDRWNIIKL